MDHETDGDGAINLSTSQRPSAATTPNGNIEYDEQDQVSTVAYFWGVFVFVTLWCRNTGNGVMRVDAVTGDELDTRIIAFVEVAKQLPIVCILCSGC